MKDTSKACRETRYPVEPSTLEWEQTYATAALSPNVASPRWQITRV